MSVGTPNFVGSRLCEAREARGLTQTALSEMLGLTRAAISAYENGRNTPSAEVLDRISQVLRIPMHRFMRKGEHRVSGTVFYRSMSATTKGARERAERRFGWLQKTTDWLAESIEFPEVKLPKIDVPIDPRSLTYSDIERIASETRRGLGLGDGPIGDVVLLLENHGVITVRQELGAATLDAFSHWNNGRPFIVLGSEKKSAVRSRFDAAHELAHCILHRRVEPARLNNTSTNRLLEDQAHYFAGAFLLPPKSFSADVFVPTLNGLVPLKSKWRVSIGAMIKRAYHLDLITEQQQRRLFSNRSRRGWAMWEPLDDELEIENPRFIRRCFELLLEQGLADRVSIETELGLFVEDIESTCGLADGFLGDTVQNYRFPIELAARNYN